MEGQLRPSGVPRKKPESVGITLVSLGNWNSENAIDLIATRRVLELGSGVGFLGIVIASLQLEHSKLSGGVEIGSLYLTDVNEEVLLRCQKNLLLSCSKHSPFA
jgi:hypothetical protein